jgi:hypothetical protein
MINYKNVGSLTVYGFFIVADKPNASGDAKHVHPAANEKKGNTIKFSRDQQRNDH